MEEHLDKCRRGRSYETEAEAAEGLEEVRARRLKAGHERIEKRYYEHRKSQGGCGKWHLTAKDYVDDQG